MSEWKVVELGNIGLIKGGKRLPKGEQLTNIQTNHPYIRTTDITKNNIQISDLLFVPENVFPKISRYIVEEGDVIISIVGTIGLIAKIPKQLHNANLTENCAKIVDLDKDIINKDFLFYYLVPERKLPVF